MSQGLNRKFDYSDIVARDGDGRRYELVDGGLLVTPHRARSTSGSRGGSSGSWRITSTNETSGKCSTRRSTSS